MAKANMIALQNISYRYVAQSKNRIEEAHPPVQMHFNLQIAKGERVVVIGPSGAGKSTLLNLIAGFVLPDSGKIMLNQQDMTHTLPGNRPVSMLFQENNLFDHLTVAQNVVLGIKPSLKISQQEQREVAAILSKVGLEDQMQRYPHQLSGGQKQRVALARCLIQHRPILLLDEPFSALDQALRFEMLALINSICDEFDLTLIMVSHFLDHSLQQFTRCLVINNGEIIFDDQPAALYQPAHQAVAALLGMKG